MPEKRIVLRNCGAADSRDLESYLGRGGFAAFRKARDFMKPDHIIEEVRQSGLTGRGGAGFSCGLKWQLAKNTKAGRKFLICNADEGEVGAFKDRYLLTHDPFGLIEGMCIAGLAIGATAGTIYLRAEYHSLFDPLSRALEQVRSRGFLQQMDIVLFEGAGAYICGEESALMNSLEGLRGESRFKPPYPPVRGLFGQPTVINNVETLMNIPYIIQHGAREFSAIGTRRSKGTKVFSVSGDVRNPGVYELPMGASLKELVVDLAGARDIKAVQIGGATGNILPAHMLDSPLCHEAYLGCGAIVVLNSSRNIVDAVRNDMTFLHEESCGKCTPCRDGLEVMKGVYDRIASGEGVEDDIRVLEELSRVMSQGALCGLGQAAPVPVLDSLRYFRADYTNLIQQAAYIRNYAGRGPAIAP
ncbi:MAG: complex I 51 kDa subunit family protein [Thermodesulfobacteriota bacterium]